MKDLRETFKGVAEPPQGTGGVPGEMDPGQKQRQVTHCFVAGDTNPTRQWT